MIASVLVAAAVMLQRPAALAEIWLGTAPLSDRMRSTRYGGPFVPPRTLRLALIVTRDAGSTRAFVLDRERNLGAFIGTRTLTIRGTRVTLARPNRPPIEGTLRGGTLRLNLPGIGRVAFRHATRGEARGLTSLSPSSVAVGAQPPRTGDGWATARPRDAGVDPAALQRLVAALAAPPATLRARRPHALLVARHGRLVVESYFAGYERETPHDLRSAGKSLAPLLVALAARHDPTLAFDSPVLARVPVEGPPQPDPRIASITLADLLSMRSGLACNDDDDASPGNEDRMQSQTAQPDWYRYTLALPVIATPGTSAFYCSAGIHLAGAVIPGAAHATIAQVFERDLARPLGITRYALPFAPAPRDAVYLGGGQFLRPRDLLKLGQLVLGHGRWNGARVIDARAIATMTTPRTHVHGELGDYGLGWHVYRYAMRGRVVTAISAGGNGGQLVLAIPAYDLAIAITAGNYGQYPVWRAFITSTVPRVLDAVAGAGANARILDRER